MSESDILAMQIDPFQVTVSDIRRYEKLMSGKAVRALSNAHTMMGLDSQDASGRQMFTKHHWIMNEKDIDLPIELEFEQPTSLISLNIELTFNCKDGLVPSQGALSRQVSELSR